MAIGRFARVIAGDSMSSGFYAGTRRPAPPLAVWPERPPSSDFSFWNWNRFNAIENYPQSPKFSVLRNDLKASKQFFRNRHPFVERSSAKPQKVTRDPLSPFAPPVDAIRALAYHSGNGNDRVSPTPRTLLRKRIFMIDAERRKKRTAPISSERIDEEGYPL